MKLKLLLIGLISVWSLINPTKAIAIVNPTEVANNKIGIHLLDPGEIDMASKLVNNNGEGQWGYVTVPIQAVDRNLVKWQAFMDKCREQKIIPIIRVATVPEGANWQEPSNFELIDFANFLSDLNWPTKNRYIVIFNEVNHATEFGGYVRPERYALILLNSIKIFKERNEDFFILPSAMDNATLSDSNSLNWRSYLSRMNRAQPGIFNMIDGWNSHAYPNPGMAGRVTDRSDQSVRSYEADLSHLKSLGVTKDLKVFITETGWDSDRVGGLLSAVNLGTAFRTVWNDTRVVAVTPFLFRAGDGPFTKFSFLNQDGSPRGVYGEWQRLATVKGLPVLNESVNQPLYINIGSSLPTTSVIYEVNLLNWKNIWNGLFSLFKVQ